jgi:hypothetical protein
MELFGVAVIARSVRRIEPQPAEVLERAVDRTISRRGFGSRLAAMAFVNDVHQCPLTVVRYASAERVESSGAAGDANQ